MTPLKLYQYKSIFGLPNPGPFCMKLETYLRLAQIPYTVVTIKGRVRSPTGKVPYVEIDGTVMTDSRLIIEHLEATHGHPVDGRLTLAERAQSLAFQRLMEEHLYWAAVYMRWVDPATRAAWRPYMQEQLGVPGLLAPLVAYLSERSASKMLHTQGIGRLGPEGIWRMGRADVQALAHWLGNRPWGFGGNPTTFDACLAAIIGNIVRTPWANPLTAVTLKCTNLVAHFERLMAQAFPELAV